MWETLAIVEAIIIAFTVGAWMNAPELPVPRTPERKMRDATDCLRCRRVFEAHEIVCRCFGYGGSQVGALCQACVHDIRHGEGA